MFNYHDCRFRVDQSKLGTGRVVNWKEYLITNSFTLECSFHGFTYGPSETQEFTLKGFMEVGASVAKAILEYQVLNGQIEKETQV